MLGYSEVGEPQWLPWRMDDDVLTVATAVAPSTAEIAEEAARRFGAAAVEFPHHHRLGHQPVHPALLPPPPPLRISRTPCRGTAGRVRTHRPERAGSAPARWSCLHGIVAGVRAVAADRRDRAAGGSQRRVPGEHRLQDAGQPPQSLRPHCTMPRWPRPGTGSGPPSRTASARRRNGFPTASCPSTRSWCRCSGRRTSSTNC